eukprot:gene23975-31122_t
MLDEDEMQRRELSRLLSTAKSKDRKDLIKTALNKLDNNSNEDRFDFDSHTLTATLSTGNLSHSSLFVPTHSEIAINTTNSSPLSYKQQMMRPMSARKRPSTPSLLDAIPENQTVSNKSSEKHGTNESASEIFLPPEDDGHDPVTANPAVLEEISDSIMCGAHREEEVNKRRKVDHLVTTVKEDVVDAVIKEQSVIQNFSGDNTSPPAWFAGAMAAALAPLEARMNLAEKRMNIMDARIFNASAIRQSDTIMAPIIPPAVTPPNGFPATLGELFVYDDDGRMLDISAYLAVYGLTLPDGVAPENDLEKRKVLARFLGLPF